MITASVASSRLSFHESRNMLLNRTSAVKRLRCKRRGNGRHRGIYDVAQTFLTMKAERFGREIQSHSLPVHCWPYAGVRLTIVPHLLSCGRFIAFNSESETLGSLRMCHRSQVSILPGLLVCRICEASIPNCGANLIASGRSDQPVQTEASPFRSCTTKHQPLQ